MFTYTPERFLSFIENNLLDVRFDFSFIDEEFEEKERDVAFRLETEFHQDWRLINALKNGIGIHHRLTPKYIQKEIISLFNRKLLRVLVFTTTITEGVNMSAKYLIVTEAMKGTKELKNSTRKILQEEPEGSVITIKGMFLFYIIILCEK